MLLLFLMFLAALPDVSAQDYGHVICVVFSAEHAPVSKSLAIPGCTHYVMSSSDWTAQFMFIRVEIPKCGMGKIKCATIHLLQLARGTWPLHHVLFLDSRDVLCENIDVVSRLTMNSFPEASAIALGAPALGISGMVLSPDGLQAFLQAIQTSAGPYCKCLTCILVQSQNTKLAIMEHKWVVRKKQRCFKKLARYKNIMIHYNHKNKILH